MALIKIEQAIEEINNYWSSEEYHYPLLVNCENYIDYNNLITQYKADETKKIIYISDYCINNTFPNVESLLYDIVFNKQNIFIAGISQLLFFQGSQTIKKVISMCFNDFAKGKFVILLDHCQLILQELISNDSRRKNSCILIQGERQSFPKIIISKKNIFKTTIQNCKDLLQYLEQTPIPFNASNDIYAILPFSKNIFNNPAYSMEYIDSIYQKLKLEYPIEFQKLNEESGTEEQWNDLSSNLQKYKTFTSVIENVVGKISNIPFIFNNILNTRNKLKLWYLWLAITLFNIDENQYLLHIIKKTTTINQLERNIYLGLLDFEPSDINFNSLYQERKNILQNCNENIPLLDEYIDLCKNQQKNAIFYYTDKTQKEELAFIQALNIYDYSFNEIQQIVKFSFPELYYYLHEFIFNQINLNVSDTQLHKDFTQYFNQYKIQKLSNKIFPNFIDTINKYANIRPYNKVLPRINILQKKQMPNTEVYFFDALGVEFLGYIQKKCETYGLYCEIQVTRCELPSITEENKEFYNIFNKVNKIEELDNIKHNEQIIDYTKCKEPIHIFNELRIIDQELRKIQINLNEQKYNNALIVSDHGASRLAVIYEHDSNSSIQLSEKGKHEGRCCPLEQDPNLPFSSYQNGYVCLANYDRFKGGRKATVEVHGGATLEEVLVPIITISLKQEEIKIHFINPIIELNPRETPQIILYSSITLSKPILYINDKQYIGKYYDTKRILFELPDIKRTNTYQADIYDNELKIITLEFKTKTNLMQNNKNMLI